MAPWRLNAACRALLACSGAYPPVPEPIEEEGIRRTRERIASADLVLAVFDASCPWDKEDDQVREAVGGREFLFVCNKQDLPVVFTPPAASIPVSAKTGDGIEALKQAIRSRFVSNRPTDGVVLTNLLGNAAKFTRDVEARRVELGRVLGDPSGPGAFFVQDNGAGFDAARATTLFQPFVRLHRSEQFQGTGLGLSIVRRIIERHGGSVGANGEPGHGARFVFRFGPPRAAELSLPLDAIDSQRDAAA